MNNQEQMKIQRNEFIGILRMVQILLIIMVISNIMSWWMPILSIANLITAALGIYFEWKIEKKIKKKQEEEDNQK